MNEADINYFELIEQKFRDKNIIADFRSYIDNLELQNFPIILSIKHLAKVIGVPGDLLTNMMFGSRRFYREFNIPKRSGDTRSINSPLPSLCFVQRWIAKNILNKVELSDAAHGFREGKSIITNASVHCKNAYLLKMDIRDFFPSIIEKRVFGMFRSFGYTRKVSVALAKLTTLNGTIPQGAPTSPAISNIICRKLDLRVGNYCKKLELFYTRYADDMAISGNKIDFSIMDTIEYIIGDEGFDVHHGKTLLLKPGRKKIVTGISISDGQLKLPRKARREIRRDCFFLMKNGIEKESERFETFDPLYIDRLVGRLAFWKSIEQDNRYVEELFLNVKELSRSL